MLTQVIKLVADATGVQKGAAQAAAVTKNAFSNVGKEITGRMAAMLSAGAVIDKIAGFTRSVMDNADALDEMSDIMNMSIEDIQRLQAAANLAGIPFKKIKGILDGIANLQQQAATGDKRAAGIFSALGIDPTNASAMSIMVSAIDSLGKGTKQQGAAADILGKRLNDVAAVVRALKDLGPISLITTEQAKTIAKANDDMEEAFRKARVSATPAVTGGLNVFTAFLDNLGFRGGLPLFHGMAKNMLGKYFGSSATEGGVDLSALPLPPGKGRKPPVTPQPAALPAAISLAPQSDALARIGLFVGGAGRDASQSLVSIGNYQLTELRRIRNVLEDANR